MKEPEATKPVECREMVRVSKSAGSWFVALQSLLPRHLGCQAVTLQTDRDDTAQPAVNISQAHEIYVCVYSHQCKLLLLSLVLSPCLSLHVHCTHYTGEGRTE